MSVRVRPSAPSSVPGCVAVARRTLDPLALVRIQARQPKLIQKVTQWPWTYPGLRLHSSGIHRLQAGGCLTTDIPE